MFLRVYNEFLTDNHWHVPCGRDDAMGCPGTQEQVFSLPPLPVSFGAMCLGSGKQSVRRSDANHSTLKSGLQKIPPPLCSSPLFTFLGINSNSCFTWTNHSTHLAVSEKQTFLGRIEGFSAAAAGFKYPDSPPCLFICSDNNILDCCAWHPAVSLLTALFSLQDTTGDHPPDICLWSLGHRDFCWISSHFHSLLHSLPLHTQKTKGFPKHFLVLLPFFLPYSVFPQFLSFIL